MDSGRADSRRPGMTTDDLTSVEGALGPRHPRWETKSFHRLIAPQHARQREEHVFVGSGDGLDGYRVAFGETADDFFDKNLRRRGAGRHDEAGDRSEQRPVDFRGALNQRRAWTAGALGHFLEALGIGG